MADSDADRVRRHRAHQAGDHSLCRPQSCDLAPPPSWIEDPKDGEWGPGGAQLWAELHDVVPISHRALLREACRIVDRLDRMDAILERKSDWLRINQTEFPENVKVTVTMTGVLSEARQQAAVAQSLIKDLAQFVKPQPKPAPKTGGLGDLSARIAARRGQSAG